MRPDTQDAARLLARTLPAVGTGPLTGRIAGHLGRRALAAVARRLLRSPAVEHRKVAAALVAAMDEGDDAAALALVSTAGRRPDLRAEKIVSRKYRYLWICNPKAASRSIIATLRAADPGAQLIRNRTLEAVLAAHPEARDYFRFAFLRHPVERTRSCWADKHGLARTDRDARRWFIDPWYGLSAGMGFDAFCRWLDTPFGSDAFADRHWLSQHRQLRDGDGRLPEFLGHYECLDADWGALCDRLGLPLRALPRLNPRPEGCEAALADAGTAALLRRRYAEDCRLGGYGGDGHGERA